MKINTKLVDNVSKLPVKNNGNWYDCYCRKIEVFYNGMLVYSTDENDTVRVLNGSVVIVYLGIATDIPKGYEGHVLPRSSTFAKYGLILGNGMGIIDDTYCGNTDEWRAMFYATRDNVFLNKDMRLTQINIVKTPAEVSFKEVQDLGNKDRGGFGSTGK